MEWSDLRIFLAVAREPSLRRAARALGVGQPTVARRLQALESALGIPLFERTPDGHRLTRAGEDLLPLAESIGESALAIERRLATLAAGPDDLVRIVAAEWPARFVAGRVSALSAAGGPVVELAESHGEPDLARREADIFIRHGLPARGNLVTRRIGSLPAAVYAARSYVRRRPEALADTSWRECDWVAYDAPHGHFASMAWLAAQVDSARLRVRANRLALQHEAVRAGAGLGILPCFLADVDPALVAVSAPIADLAADLWVVTHPDTRTRQAVRRAVRWLESIFAPPRAAPDA